MKTKIKRHYRSVLSVVLSLCMLVSCMTVGLIATDAAKVTDSGSVETQKIENSTADDDTVGASADSDEVGASAADEDAVGAQAADEGAVGAQLDNDAQVGVTTYYLLYSTSNNPTGMTSKKTSTTQSFTIVPSDLGLTSFAVGTNYYVAVSSSTSYTEMWSQNKSSAAVNNSSDYLSTSSESYNVTDSNNTTTTYNFAHFTVSDDSVSSVTIAFSNSGGTEEKTTYTFSATASAGTATWTVVGDSTELFTKKWDTTGTNFDLENTTGTTWTKTFSNVYLSSGAIEYKIAKNHAWTTSYPSSNKKATVETAGYYDVTVTFDSSSKEMSMTFDAATKYTLTVPTVEHATVTANYGSSSAAEGGTISDIPAGASVTVNVSVDSGYKCTGVANGAGTAGTGSGSKWTVTMPAADTTLAVAIQQYSADIKRVYFYNKFTQYPLVKIYAYYKDGSGNITEKIFGTGKNMTQMSNSDIWYIDLPEDAYIEFIGDGYSTGELKPLNQHSTQPKYIPGSDRTSPRTGGYWGEYVDRTNHVYTVSDGENMSSSNLFTGINATFYDYYVDHEVTGGWLTGITAESDYVGNPSAHTTYNDPYREYFNKALSAYSQSNSLTYPLYWGNNKSAKDNNGYSILLYGWNKRINNIEGISPNTTAMQGLAGKTLAGGKIHHYSSADTTNNNGAYMPFFDEDFLLGENTTGKALATILHSSSFPVRKETLQTVYFDNNTANKTIPSNETICAHIWNSSNASVDVVGQNNNGIYAFSAPAGYNNIIFYHASASNPAVTLDNKYTGDLSFITSTPQYNGSDWVSHTGDSTHNYYEYDSTGGKDNAFITSIDPTNHTANLSYYTNKSVVSQSSGNPEGFFPFDYNNMWGGSYNVTKVYLDPSQSFSDNGTHTWAESSAWFAAVFRNKNNADDVTWVKMTHDDTLGLYYANIPSGHENDYLIFARMNKDDTSTLAWSNKWNDTGNQPIPTNQNVVCTITGWNNSCSWGSNAAINVPFTPGSTNDYSAGNDSNKLAHDQGFGMKMEIPFTLGKNGLNADGTAQTFEFSGDDDLWVYVDDKLILDLGGAHGATQGSINFNTMVATAKTAAPASGTGGGTVQTNNFSSVLNTAADDFNPDKKHTMTIYYMERGMFDSNLKFGFSFHAIPNSFMAEKKVRTRVVDGYTNNFINSGFFNNNGQTGDASNMSGVYIDNGTRQITKFENSFQDETFTFTQTYDGNLKDNATDLKYTIGDNTTTITSVSSPFTYTMHNNNDGENIAYFNGQFTSGETFTLKESSATNNKYNYDTYLIVYDDAANSKKFAPVSDVTAAGQVSGNNTDGYTFRFSPTTLVASGGLEDLRIRARFENSMREHSLTIKKDALDFSGDKKFEFKILFDFEGNGNYISYPLEILNSTEKVAGDGTFSLLGNESITLEGIPEKAKIKLIETSLNGNDTYSYDRTIVRTDAGAEYKEVTELGYISGTQEGGVTFEMGTADTIATVRNAAAQPVFISHTLHPDSRGDAYCFVSAQVKTSGGTLVENGTFDETQGIIQVGTDFINKASDNNLVITLRTVPKGNALFDGNIGDDSGFYEGISNVVTALDATGTKYTATVNTEAKTAIITVPIRGLFDNENGGKQLHTQLPFYSKTKLPPYQYEFTYNFATRKLIEQGKMSHNTLWGNQSYKSKAVFTDAEVDELIDLSGTPAFKSDKSADFLAAKSPYETNFMENLKWTFTGHTIEYDDKTYTFSCSLTAQQDLDTTIQVKFMMPFEYTLDTSTTDHYTFTVSDRVYKDYANVTTSSSDISMDFLDWFSLNDVHNQSQITEEKQPELLTVPDVLYNAAINPDKKRTFRYWEYYTENADGDPGVCYQKSYSSTLNQAIYQNTILKPVYSEEKEMSAQEQKEVMSDKTASITFLGTTRDQWNYGGGGNANGLWGNSKFGDRIFTDFMLSFEYEGKQINTIINSNFNTGLIIETLDVGNVTELENGWDTSYQTEHGDGKTAAENTIKTTTLDTAGTAAAGSYMVSFVDKTKLDPRNAIEYYYGIANVSSTTYPGNDTYTNPTARRNFGYRAYSFIKDTTGSTPKVYISDPVYFTIYDIATITDGSEQAASAS